MDVEYTEPTECDFWNPETCAEGEKCQPWGSEFSSVYYGFACIPAGEKGLGEPCCNTLQGGACDGALDALPQGADNCGAGLFCTMHDEWTEQDGYTTEFRCVPTCVGSEDAPTCADEALTCELLKDGFHPLCSSWCDPVGSACPEGMGCGGSPIAVNAAYDCRDPGLPQLRGYPEPCGASHECQPGLTCRRQSSTHDPNCSGEHCCAQMCDLTGPNTCPDGSTCEPAVAEPMDSTDHIGKCTWPQP